MLYGYIYTAGAYRASQSGLSLYIQFFTTVKFYLVTLSGTSKLQFFYVEILPEFKNKPMPKIVNAIYKNIIKVKNSFKISGTYFGSCEFRVSVAAQATQSFKGLNLIYSSRL